MDIKNNTMKYVKLTGLAIGVAVAGQANAQTVCAVDRITDGIDHLDIVCGSSDDVVKVYVEDVAQGDDLVPTLFVDIGTGPLDQGPADGLKRVLISTGDGNDDVSLRDLDPDRVQVVTGRGADKVAMGPNVLADELIDVDTGAGDDTVALGLNVSSEIDLRVRTRSGGDSVSTFAASPLGIYGVWAGRNLIISGGVGVRDNITVGPDSLAGGRVILRGFTVPTGL